MKHALAWFDPSHSSICFGSGVWEHLSYRRPAPRNPRANWTASAQRIGAGRSRSSTLRFPRRVVSERVSQLIPSGFQTGSWVRKRGTEMNSATERPNDEGAERLLGIVSSPISESPAEDTQTGWFWEVAHLSNVKNIMTYRHVYYHTKRKNR